MKWLLNELVRYHEEPLHINDTFDLNAMMTERFAGKVLQVAPVVVDAYVSSDNGDVTFGITVTTTVTTPQVARSRQWNYQYSLNLRKTIRMMLVIWDVTKTMKWFSSLSQMKLLTFMKC